MTYDYICPECGWVLTRSCAVADRDGQICACGGALRRDVGKTARAQIINIPMALHTSESDILPQSEEMQARWRAEGVRREGARWF